ncbi:MAG: hypothetical protein COZ18_11370 [Flexibacter sp. CG_4_10_14_3_um_filter_32_15]|nr:MAG: hypothetical protein COZ18_11370 [Flexibacter sp. CG_4_10_14_3_um_filter_32_15]
MQKNILTDLFQKYIPTKEGDASGLLLLDLPTGFGKTYSIMEFIYKTYRNHDKNIIFLTNLKKNLDKNSLQKFFEANDEIEQYEKDVIFLDSNSDSVIENLEKVRDEITDDILNSSAFKNLDYQINTYNRSKENKYQKDFTDFTKNEIRQKYEPIFRNEVIKFLNDNFTIRKDKIEAIKNFPKYNWIGKLYPAVFTSEKRIFFMSIKKFLVKNSTIVGSSHSFIDENFLQNAIIIIDEFDASKEVILEHIIQQQLQHRISLINLFSQIYSSFISLDLPEDYYEESERSKDENKWRKENNKRAETPREIIEKLIKATQELHKKYNFNYSFKTIGIEKKRTFLFHDERYSTITGDKEKRFIHLKTDIDKKLNQIIISEQKSEENPSIIDFINQLRGFINHFKSSSKIIAENYQYLVNQEREEKNDIQEIHFSYENALKSFFNQLKISKENIDYLVESILSEGVFRENKRKQKADNFENQTFYEKGVRYYEFEDNENHNTKSHVYSTDFNRTPEKLLLDISQTNFVVGLSATATIETVLGNYDLSYLRRNLTKEKLLKISKEEQSKLKEIFDERNKNYVGIETSFINTNRGLETELKSLGFEGISKNKMLTELEKYDDKSYYIVERYLRIAKAYQNFVKYTDIKSFLCFLTILPKSNSIECNENILKTLFEQIEKAQNHEDRIQYHYIILDSTNFEDEKKLILERLSRGEKIFVITTYKTLGAGQNLQYSIPENLQSESYTKKVFTRSSDDKLEKDFDAIYLDKPTNLIVNNKETLSEEQKAKRIFHLEMLHESDKIDKKQLKQEVKNTLSFKGYYENSGVKFSTLTDFREFLIKEIVQAIGRISRATYKNSTVYVFADEQIVPFIQNINIEEKLYLKEFEKLVTKAKLIAVKEVKEDDSFYDKQMKRTTLQAKSWIDGKIARQFTRQNDIEEWQQLREMVLKYPTIDLEEYQSEKPFSSCQFAYVPISEEGRIIKKDTYFFKNNGSNEFEDIEISISNRNWKEVSQNEARLKDLMQIDFLREMFELNDYATSFQENSYILSPIIFNNIYKGALGEIVGKFILEKDVLPKNTLKELSESIFEKFDYVYNENIFIDFKFWSEKNEQSREKQIDKIHRKIKFLEEKNKEVEKVIIINIFAKTSYKNTTSLDKRIIEIPFLIEEENSSYKISTSQLSKISKLLLTK